MKRFQAFGVGVSGLVLVPGVVQCQVLPKRRSFPMKKWTKSRPRGNPSLLRPSPFTVQRKLITTSLRLLPQLSMDNKDLRH